MDKEICNAENVWTHNPWGEYGHEEHVQVYRAVTKLQKIYNFKLWFPAYVSNKSKKLFIRYIDVLENNKNKYKTNYKVIEKIKKIYIKNGCWTWFDNWTWFDEEWFINENSKIISKNESGLKWQLNIIQVRYEPKRNKKRKLIKKLRSITK